MTTHAPELFLSTLVHPLSRDVITVRGLSPAEKESLHNTSVGIGWQARECIKDMPSSSDPGPVLCNALEQLAQEAEPIHIGAFSRNHRDSLVGFALVHTVGREIMTSEPEGLATAAFGEIDLIGVLRNYRRKGIAGTMLDSAQSGLDLVGFQADMLHRRSPNLPARAIARRLGVDLIR